MATTVDYILRVSADQAKSNLKDVSKATKTLGADFQKTAKSMGKSMLAIAGAISGAGVAIIAFGQKVADLANEMADASTKTGLATSTLQGLKLAAEGSGLSFSNLENGLIRFQSSITSAMSGTGAASDAFKTLGIDLFNSQGELKDADQLFREATEALGNMESATLRNSTAIDLFGARAGPALAQSGALGNMHTFAELASEFGVNMENAAQEAANFQRAMAEIKLVLEGVFEGLLTTVTGTTKLSDGLFKIAEAIVYFGSIANDVLNILMNDFKAVSTVFGAIYTGIRNFGIGIKALLSGDFDFAKEVASGTKEFIEQEFEDAARTIDKNFQFDNMTESAEKAVEKLQSLRDQILSGGGAGGAGGGGGGGASGEAQALKFGDTISIDLKEFDDAISDLEASLEGFDESLKGLPSLMEKTMKIAGVGIASEIALQAASGPAGTIQAIGEGLEKLTMGMSGIISDAVLGIARLGEKSPKEIQAEFDNFVKAFSKGLEMLPRVLIQVLPRFVRQLTVGILKGILKLPFIIADAIGEVFARAWNAIKEFFKSIFTKEGRQERRRERRARRERGERGPIGEFFENLSESSAFYMSGGIYRAQSGIRFTGAKRGLAMLHEGESVIPASGRTGQAEQRSFNQSGGGGGVNIIINSAVVENRAIDELVRRLENRFGTFGVGKSSLFGR